MKNTKIAKKAATILTAGVLAITTAPGVVFAKANSETVNDNTTKTEQSIANDSATEVISDKANDINCVVSTLVDSKIQLEDAEQRVSEGTNKKVEEGILLNYMFSYIRAKASNDENVSPTDIIPLCYAKNEETGKLYKFGYKVKDDFDKTYIKEQYAGEVKTYDTINANEKLILNVDSDEEIYITPDENDVYYSLADSLKNPEENKVSFISNTINEEFGRTLNNGAISPMVKELTTDQINYGIKQLYNEYYNINEKDEIVKTR